MKIFTVLSLHLTSRPTGYTSVLAEQYLQIERTDVDVEEEEEKI